MFIQVILQGYTGSMICNTEHAECSFRHFSPKHSKHSRQQEGRGVLGNNRGVERGGSSSVARS